MNDQVFSAVVAGGASVAGGLVVAVSNYKLNRAQAADARKEAVRRTLVEFLAIVNRIDHQLRVEPEPGPLIRRARAFWDRLPNLDYAAGRLNTRLLNPRLDTLVQKANEVFADAVITLPLDVLPTMEAVADLMGEVAARDANWRRRWDEARAELVRVSRTTAGEKIGTPAQSADASQR